MNSGQNHGQWNTLHPQVASYAPVPPNQYEAHPPHQYNAPYPNYNMPPEPPHPPPLPPQHNPPPPSNPPPLPPGETEENFSDEDDFAELLGQLVSNFLLDFICMII